MHSSKFRSLAAAAALLGAMLSGAYAAIPQPLNDASDELVAPVMSPLSLSNPAITVVLKMNGDPVAVRQGNAGRRLSRDEKNAIKAQLKASQDALRGSIESLGGSVLATYQSSYNGIKVRVTRDKLAALAALPGVVAVRPTQPKDPSNVRSVPFIGTPAVWQSLGIHGEGVKLAIIDTGIDYTHANFGGPGTQAAYAAAHAHETAPPDPSLVGPSAPRVKGGIDLVGDSYNANPSNPATYQPVPHPDPNPLDCNGHGSHVAGSAAGSGVTAAGNTYTGSYDGSTISSNNWIIGPGVAPKADIYSIRVFGCAGSTDVVVDAIEWAVDNDMDIVSMSLGSDFGSRDDPDAEASTNAVQGGIVVVAAAGNAGPNPYIVSSPSVSDGAISVAANDSTQSFPGAIISIPGATMAAIDANGATLAPSASYTVKVLTGANVLGCSVAAFGGPNSLPPNTIAVVQRGVCARVAKAIFGQQAGAAAVVMVNNATSLPPFEGPITQNPDDGIPYLVTIPFLGVRGLATTAGTDGAKLSAAGGATATVVPTTLANAAFKSLASFSSAGPRGGDSAMKPEITAPGVSIVSTLNGSGNGPTILSGTSMATPHVAGAAALTIQAHPAWKIDDLKAAIVGTASPSGVAGYSVRGAGAGLVQPAGSTATQVVAAPNGDKFAAALNFGFSDLKNDYTKTATISLRNNGDTAASFTVAQANAVGSPHSVSFDPASVTVPAHASAVVAVTLSVPAATAGAANGAGLSFRQVSGGVQFTPVSASDNAGVALRVPYYLVPRANSAVSTALGQLKGTNPSATATVGNKSVAAISGDADFYAWGILGGQDANGAHQASPQNVYADVRAVGAQSFPFDATRQLIVFAVNTWNRWSSPSQAEFDIAVDVNGDGIDDYVIVGVDDGAVRTGLFSGKYGVFVFSTRSPGASAVFAPVAPTDSSVALLPVLSSQLCRTGEPCLSAAHPRLTYHITGFDIFNGGADAVAGAGRFNAWTNAITTGGFATVAPGASDASNTVAVNSAEFAQTPALGVMVVTLDNKAGADQAQLIKVDVK